MDEKISGAVLSERGDAYEYEELIKRDMASLDVLWLRDESLEESDNRPDPDALAQEIVVPRLDSTRPEPGYG